MKPLDFNDVLDFMIARNAFEDYDVPLGPSTRDNSSGFDFRRPRYPGDPSYGNGVMMVKEYGANIPPEFVAAQYQSMMDALNLYMHPFHLGPFMCGFYRQGEFLSDPSYLKIADYPLPQPLSGEDRIRHGYSAPIDQGHLALLERARNTDRTYFSEPDCDLVKRVCSARPELKKTVLAFQAGFLAYLEQLKSAMVRNDEDRLTDKQRTRGMKVVDLLIDQWSTKNFSRELLPAICLAYSERDQSLASPPVAEDFDKGFRGGFKMGLFHHIVPAPNGIDAVELLCPAKMAIRTLAMKDPGKAEVCARSADPFPMGRMMASICKAITTSPAARSGRAMPGAAGATLAEPVAV